MRISFFGLTFTLYETGLATIFSHFQYMEEIYVETSHRMGHFTFLRIKRLFLIVNITLQKFINCL